MIRRMAKAYLVAVLGHQLKLQLVCMRFSVQDIVLPRLAAILPPTTPYLYQP